MYMTKKGVFFTPLCVIQLFASLSVKCLNSFQNEKNITAILCSFKSKEEVRLRHEFVLVWFGKISSLMTYSGHKNYDSSINLSIVFCLSSIISIISESSISIIKLAPRRTTMRVSAIRIVVDRV